MTDDMTGINDGDDDNDGHEDAAAGAVPPPPARAEITEITLDGIEEQTAQAAREVREASRIGLNDIFVLGCSSSEILGHAIGTHTSMDVAPYVLEGMRKALDPFGIFLAVQCCEHLNRALVVERECMERYDLEQVNVIPQPNHAGGALGTIAYMKFRDPVVVEDIHSRAKAGMDIGDTLIGMHMRPVCVPLRISLDHIGYAHLVCARYRPRYVGGARARYDENLM